MARLLIVDDHLAVRAGLRSVLRLAPAIEIADAVGDVGAALETVSRRRVDAAIVDYRLGDGDGLHLCRVLKKRCPGIGVVLYTAFAAEALAIAATVAGADALVSKGAPAEEVIDAVLAALRGESRLPELSAAGVRAAGERLAPDDLPLFGLRIHGASDEDVAAALGRPPESIDRRLDAMLAALAPRIAIQSPGLRAAQAANEGFSP